MFQNFSRFIAEPIWLAILVVALAGGCVIFLRGRKQNRVFITALDNMSQGLCLFDGSQRLDVCNTTYSRIYDSSRTVVTPCFRIGVILASLFNHGVLP